MNYQTQSLQSQRLAVLAGLNALTAPKENETYHIEQPPAYTASAPSSRPGLIESLVQRASSSPQGATSPRFAMDDEDDDFSPISLRVSTRVNVARDGNLIALPCSPAEQANSIAKAVVEAIQGRDWTSGLPMIDNDGRPRPFVLDVDAGITIEGSSNVIGTEAVISDFLRRSPQVQRKASPTHQLRQDPSSASTEAGPMPKRRRRASDTDLVEEPTIKRTRSED